MGREFYSTRVDPSISVKGMNEEEVFYIDKAGKKKGLGEKQYPGKPEELEALEEEVKQLVQKTGIKLAGLDVLRKEGSDEFYVIDLNHYPSYTNLEGFREKFEAILLEEGGKKVLAEEVAEELD